jgi:uncharacterized protein YbdZ (MbtH family)
VNKRSVKRIAKDAFCVRLNDRSGYVVWPGKIQPRGFERSAIGYGKTARQAWASVEVEP